MKLSFPAERGRGTRAVNLIREEVLQTEHEFDLEQEVTGEDWTMAWALVDRNTLDRPAFHGGGARSWEHIGVLTTWISLVDPQNLHQLRDDERIKSLAQERLRWSGSRLDSEATGKILFPELLSQQMKTDPQLLEIFSPFMIDNTRSIIRQAGHMFTSSEGFVQFLQVRPQELVGVQKVIEANPDLWSSFEQELDRFMSVDFAWRNAVEAAANMVLLRPGVQTALQAKLRPYLPRIKKELKEDRARRPSIVTDDWTQGELYTLEACRIMSSLAILFGDQPRVNEDGVIQVNRKQSLTRPTELPTRPTL